MTLPLINTKFRDKSRLYKQDYGFIKCVNFVTAKLN